METTDGFPGAAGRIPQECATVSHVLQDNGYSTFWVGKDHNVPEEDNAPGGNRSMWPLQLGFDRFYGFLGGETNNWYPDLVEDNHYIEQPYSPEEGYHLSKDLADQALHMLRNQQASNPSKPGISGSAPAPTTHRTTRPRSTSPSTRAPSTTATRRTGSGCWPGWSRRASCPPTPR